MKRNFIVIILLVLIATGCSKGKKNETKIELKKLFEITEQPSKKIFFSISSRLIKDKNNNIWIANFSFSPIICEFDASGKKLIKKITFTTGKGPGELSKLGFKTFDMSDTLIAVLDAMFYRISFFNKKGKFLSSFKVNYMAYDLKFLNNNEIIVLGKSNKKIFHKYDITGNLLGDFGDQIDENPSISPTIMAIDTENNIFVPAPKGYEIVKYVDLGKNKIFYGERKNIKGYKISKRNGNYAISFPSGINGLLINKDYLFVTTYNAKEKEFFLDIFSKKGKKIIYTKKLDKFGFINYIDSENKVYFINDNCISVFKINKAK